MFNSVIDSKCTDAEVNCIKERHESALDQLTKGLMSKPGVKINLVGRDQEGKVIGGIMCSTYLMTMFIDVLWVSEEYRGRGLGYALITEAENCAVNLGCMYVHTSTYSYQSPAFYQRQGYEVYSKNDAFPYHIWYINLRRKLGIVTSYSPIYGGLVDRNCTEAELEEIVCKNLRLYNQEKIKGLDMKECENIHLAARDGDGKAIGGILCTTFYKLNCRTTKCLAKRCNFSHSGGKTRVAERRSLPRTSVFPPVPIGVLQG